jgi:hypothetical protein
MSFQATDTALQAPAAVATADPFQPRADPPILEASPDDERSDSTTRGIAVAVLLSVSFWVLIGLAVLLLH